MRQWKNALLRLATQPENIRSQSVYNVMRGVHMIAGSKNPTKHMIRAQWATLFNADISQILHSGEHFRESRHCYTNILCTDVCIVRVLWLRRSVCLLMTQSDC